MEGQTCQQDQRNQKALQHLLTPYSGKNTADTIGSLNGPDFEAFDLDQAPKFDDAKDSRVDGQLLAPSGRLEDVYSSAAVRG